jgi:hypothetical protein
MRMFGLVADWWGLCDDQRRLLLGSPPTTLYEEWVRLAVDHGDPGLTEDALAAITNLLAIQMSLRQRLGSDLDVSRWLRTSNPVAPFSGQLPLDTILAASPGELARIHGILAAEAGPRQSPGTDIELF